MLKSWFFNGVLAGVMVSVGGAVLLSADSRIAGAVLFSVALLSICFFGFNLYTGKVGFLLRAHGKSALGEAFTGLAGNLAGTLLCGLLLAAAVPQLKETAAAACQARLLQLPHQTVIRGFFCGILMYAAVWIYREKNTPLGILFCIPAFILAGFEHSIADMFYFACAGMIFRPASLLFLLLVVLGNSLGGIFIPLLSVPKGDVHG